MSSKIRKRHNYPRALFFFLLENFSCLISHFLFSAKKKFVTKFVTAVTNFLIYVTNFVIRVTKFVTKNLL